MASSDVRPQAEFHHALYHGLWRWPQAKAAMERARLQDMDLLGHFGASGCDVVVDTIAAHAPSRPIRVAELGSGIGGALRRVVAALVERSEVDIAIGTEIVPRHCRLMQEANAAAGVPVPVAVLRCSVDALGIRDEAVDAVFATGSVSHFSDMAAVAREAYRILRPGGVFTFTDEVSLFPDEPPSDRFLELHPPDVFKTATPAERREQLAGAGFVDVAFDDLTGWARTLLRRRLMAMRLHSDGVASVYGKHETQEIVTTIEVSLREIEEGRLTPAHATARRG